MPKILMEQPGISIVDAAIVITDKNSDTHTLYVDSNGARVFNCCSLLAAGEIKWNAWTHCGKQVRIRWMFHPVGMDLTTVIVPADGVLLLILMLMTPSQPRMHPPSHLQQSLRLLRQEQVLLSLLLLDLHSDPSSVKEKQAPTRTCSSFSSAKQQDMTVAIRIVMAVTDVEIE